MARQSLILALMLVGCLGDVPHDNPLDPESPFFRNVGQLSGRVLSFYPPFQPLAEIRIELEPGPWAAVTDESGRFLFPELPADSYQLRAQGDGYSPDSTEVVVAAGRMVEETLHLDALPVFQTAWIRSAHISRWWPLEDLYLVSFEAEVTDPDGLADVQNVMVVSESLHLADTLVAGSTAGMFSRTRRAAELPNGSVQALLGHEFEFVARDKPGNARRAGPAFLARVIETVPDGLSSPDTLKSGQVIPISWNALVLPFRITYSVEVIRSQLGIPPTVVWTATGLTETRAQIADPLPAGTYVWTVAAVDEFGNWSRSREAVFELTP